MNPPTPPPLSNNEIPTRACSRALTWPQKPGDPVCGKGPFLHVAWTVDADGIDPGFVCSEHAAEMERMNWIPVQAHEVGPDCGMPGALWFLAENVCRYEDDDAGVALTATEAIGAEA